MVIRNTSSRTITLRDSISTLYTIPAYGDISLSDGLWNDTEFRRWIRLRIRDLVLDPGVSGTPDAPSDAPYITTTANAALTNETLYSALVLRGTLASRPAAGIAGRLYLITDVGAQRLTRDNGTTWDDLNIGWSFLTGIPSTFAPSAHQSSHQTGQPDALSGNIDATARHTVKNAGATVAARRAINFTGNVYTAVDNAGSEQIDILIGAAYGSSPPVSPVDGQWWIFPVDTTNGVTWKFRYNSSSASSFKWEFIGGPPLHIAVDTNETTSSLTYVALTTPMTVVLARAGDYDVHHGMVDNQTVTSSTSGFQSFDVGATPATDNDAAWTGIAAGAQPLSASTRRRKTGIAAATTLTFKHRVNGGTGAFINRWATIYPVRIS